MVSPRSALAGLLLVALLAVGQSRVAASPLTGTVCGTWVILEPTGLTDLNNRRAQIESALTLPGVVGLSLRFRWNVIDTDFSLLEAGLAIAQGKGKAFSVRVMAGKYTPARVFTDGSPSYLLSSGLKVPTPFTATGSPNLVFEAAYDEFVGRLAGWARAHGVALLHLPWYGQDWAELNLGPEVRAAPGYSLSAWTTAHRRLVDIAARYSGPELAVELPLTGSGPLATGPSAGLADYIIATVGAGSDRFFIQANGWGPNGEWGTTSATTEAQFDQIWQKPVLRGLQAIQPQDYDWTQLYGSLSSIGATYAEVYLASFSLARKELLAAEIARFADSRCAPPPPPDTTAPAVNLTAPAAGARVGGTVAVSLEATDDVAVAGVELLVDGAVVGSAGSAPATVNWDSTSVPDGNHDLVARATDAAGNVGASAPVAVTVDNTAPEVPDGLAVTAGDGEATVTFDTVTAADLAGYDVRRKLSASSTWDGPVSVTSTTATFSGLSTATSYDFSVRSRDTTGNASAWTTPAGVLIPDLQAPDVAISAPAEGARLAGTVAVTIGASDDSGSVVRVELWADGQPVARAEPPTPSVSWDTSGVADGAHGLAARAVDGAGNGGWSAPRSVVVDNTAPAVPVGVAATAGDREVTVAFDAVAAADLGGYEVRMKPSSSSTWGPPVLAAISSRSFTGLTNGTSYDFAVRSLDDLGNASVWSEPVSATPFQTDVQSPDVVVTSPAAGTRVARTVDVVADASDDSGAVTALDVLVDGAAAASADTVPATIAWDSTTVPDGPHELSASAVDGAGNVGLSAPVTVSVDNTAPPVPTGVVATPGDAGATVTFAAVSAGDLSGYEARVKPSSSATWGAPVPAAIASATFAGLTNGVSYDFAVRSLDDLGNASAWSALVSATPVVPDTQGPSAVISSPLGGARVTGIVGVAMSAVDGSGVVTGVELLVDGVLVGGASGASTTLQWDTRTVADGLHTLVARAYDGANNVGLSGPVSITVDNTAPPVPTGVAATAGDRQVTVSFAAVSAADLAGYEVRMKPSSSSTWGTPVAAGTTSATFTGLINGVSYDFAVRSRDILALVSAWSTTVSATPRAPDTQAPTTPTRLSVTQRNRTSIQICWTASTDNVGVAGYAVSRSGTQVGTTTATCFLFTGLAPNTQYTLSVRAYDAAGNLSGTTSISARTRA